MSMKFLFVIVFCHGVLCHAVTYAQRASSANAMLAVGGQTPRGVTAAAILYRTDTNGWTPAARMNQTRSTLGVAMLHNRVYAIGGFANLRCLDSGEWYDHSANKWTTFAPMTHRRCGPGVAALNDAIYAVGGRNGQTYFRSAEQYDAATDRWQAIANMTAARWALGAATVGECLYVVGGWNGTAALASAEKYCTSTRKWMPIASLKHERYYAATAVLDGHVYACGGFAVKNAFHLRITLSTCERYDQTANKWSYIAPMPYRCGAAGMAAIGGRLLLVGGQLESNFYKGLLAYNATEDRWTTLASLPTATRVLGVAPLQI